MSGKKVFSLFLRCLSVRLVPCTMQIGPFPADRGRGVNGVDLRLGNAHLLKKEEEEVSAFVGERSCTVTLLRKETK